MTSLAGQERFTDGSGLTGADQSKQPGGRRRSVARARVLQRRSREQEAGGGGGREEEQHNETQWLMAFPQGLHFLQLTTRREEPRGSGR